MYFQGRANFLSPFFTKIRPISKKKLHVKKILSKDGRDPPPRLSLGHPEREATIRALPVSKNGVSEKSPTLGCLGQEGSRSMV